MTFQLAWALFSVNLVIKRSKNQENVHDYHYFCPQNVLISLVFPAMFKPCAYHRTVIPSKRRAVKEWVFCIPSEVWTELQIKAICEENLEWTLGISEQLQNTLTKQQHLLLSLSNDSEHSWGSCSNYHRYVTWNEEGQYHLLKSGSLLPTKLNSRRNLN